MTFPTFLYFVNVPAHPRFGPRGGAPPRHSGKEKGNQITQKTCVVYNNVTINRVTSFIILLDLVCHETPAPPPCNCLLASLSPRPATQILEAQANRVRLSD